MATPNPTIDYSKLPTVEALKRIHHKAGYGTRNPEQLTAMAFDIIEIAGDALSALSIEDCDECGMYDCECEPEQEVI